MDKSDAKAVQWIAISCFAIGIAASKYEYYVNVDPDDPILKSIVHWISVNTRFDNVVRVGLSATVFTIVYKMLLKLYARPRIWNFFHSKDALGGRWIYVFRDESVNRFIFGMFDVSHDMKGISIDSGRCWYGGTGTLTEENQRGTWRSEDVAVGKSEYWIAYQMDTPNPVPGHNEHGYCGVMRVMLQKDERNKTKTWYGTICDHNAVIKHNGRIKAKRLKGVDTDRLGDWSELPTLIKEYFDVDVVSREVVVPAKVVNILKREAVAN